MATNESDPTGVAAIIVGSVTPTITTLALVLGWSTELSGNVTLAFASLINGGVALWAILRARKYAYAPTTVNAEITRVIEVRDRMPPDPPVV